MSTVQFGEQTSLKEFHDLVVRSTCLCDRADMFEGVAGLGRPQHLFFFFFCVCDRADTFEGVDLFVLDTCFCDRADKFKGVARVGRPRHLFVCHVCHTHVM